MNKLFVAICLFVSTSAVAQQMPAINDTLIPVHDPVIIRHDSTYYIFCTGQGITVFSSPDRKHWKREKAVFAQPPAWALQAVNGFRGHIWAPDISFKNGQYYLYYSISAFGKNTSCIGVATNKTLDVNSRDFKWTDHGKLIQSVPGRDLWNAIDPNLITDDSNTGWLVFGSFWNGMKMVKLDKSLTRVASPEEWYTVAARKRDFILPDSVAGDAAIEAPFIYRHGKYYYLFVSFDYCCRGEKSTYKMVVGRSLQVNGPYTDKDGVPMNLGGGSTLLEGNQRWNGVGHNAVAVFDGVDYLIYHAYDAQDRGRSKLQISPLRWVNDWPVVDTPWR